MEKIEEEIAQLSREPFRRLLALCLENAPDPTKLKYLAGRYPHHWARVVDVLTRLSGYTVAKDIVEVDELAAMSDYDLEKRVREMLKENPEVAPFSTSTCSRKKVSRKYWPLFLAPSR